MPHSQTEINGLWGYPDVARYLGCSLSNAKRLPIPRVQIGRLVRFDPAEVRAWAGSYSIPRRPERG
jgi:predicted DNA-binding transcriptional regulator AlpA